MMRFDNEDFNIVMISDSSDIIRIIVSHAESGRKISGEGIRYRPSALRKRLKEKLISEIKSGEYKESESIY